ncbi:MAG: CoB--CoM heterodisulfide reductase iron-sulfur subunit A family protein [candidate division WOR-3 bacterium]|nr:CoB--CoM heterodisulfide reductase iron-sulfur subunit A family protein [candidate division WOR-3 bacterium]
MARVGVFICHCGVNIAGKVDVARVAETIGRMSEVAFAQDYKFMCSSPGQKLVAEAIKEHGLNRVVVAACSPKMHLPTFQKTIARAGLNQYLLAMANIREQCSWVTEDREQATAKAIDLVRRQVRRVAHADPLDDVSVSLERTAVVIGGGVAGIQAALDIADGGRKVVLVEKSPSLGGRMAQLDETFPTLDCSQCILTPKMVEAAQHPNIEIRVNTTVKKVDGYVGNFEVTLERRATCVDETKCIACGLCVTKCPVKDAPDGFNAGLSTRPAIATPFPQAVPAIPVINREYCLKFTKDKCGACAKVCPAGAINYEDKGSEEKVKAGAIVVATGYQEMSPAVYTEYGGGTFPDVITGLQFERLVSSTGPTEGKLVRPSDGREPQTIVFVQCVGSRDPSKGHEYCSGVCCMYTAKHAMLYKHHVPDGNAYVSYIDIRSPGKDYEQFVRRAIEADDVKYIRGRAGKIQKLADGRYRVFTEDTLVGRPVAIDADMVVLASAVEPNADARQLAQTLNIAYDADGFYTEAHPKLKPVETATAGVFLAGACQGPKDIPASVQQGSAAAAKVLALFANETLRKSPQVAQVDASACTGCLTCAYVCHYSAIEEKQVAGRQVAFVVAGKCQGCGACAAACKNKAVTLAQFSDDEVFEEMMR